MHPEVKLLVFHNENRMDEVIFDGVALGSLRFGLVKVGFRMSDEVYLEAVSAARSY